MLQAVAVEKSHGARAVVQGLSLQARPGEVLGLLGPNGAGKSTTVSMLCGLTAPDRGQVGWVDQGRSLDSVRDADAFKRHIGLVPQDIALHEQLSAMANLQLFAALHGLDRALSSRRAREVLDRVGLADRAGDRPAHFSGGMKRRLNIACALVHDPAVLLLDEPTAGVDPQSRNAIFDHLEALKHQGKALVYTTHYLEEVERLADRILVIDAGRAVAEGRLDDLLAALPEAVTLEVAVDGPVDLLALQAVPGVTRARLDGARLQLSLDDLGRTAPAVLAALAAQGRRVRQLRSGGATLEDAFLTLTGRQLRD